MRLEKSKCVLFEISISNIHVHHFFTKQYAQGLVSEPREAMITKTADGDNLIATLQRETYNSRCRRSQIAPEIGVNSRLSSGTASTTIHPQVPRHAGFFKKPYETPFSQSKEPIFTGSNTHDFSMGSSVSVLVISFDYWCSLLLFSESCHRRRQQRTRTI